MQWKDSIDIGKISNQNFTSIPHKKFLDFLAYMTLLTSPQGSQAYPHGKYSVHRGLES